MIAKAFLKLKDKYEDTPRAVQIEELLTLPFLGVALIGMFGFVREIAIFSALFWKVYFLLSVFYLAVSFFLPKNKWMKTILEPKKYLMLNVVASILSLPLIYMLGAYAFITFPSFASA